MPAISCVYHFFLFFSLTNGLFGYALVISRELRTWYEVKSLGRSIGRRFGRDALGPRQRWLDMQPYMIYETLVIMSTHNAIIAADKDARCGCAAVRSDRANFYSLSASRCSSKATHTSLQPKTPHHRQGRY